MSSMVALRRPSSSRLPMIAVADFVQLVADVEHVQLPLEMLAERLGMRKKLFEARSVVFVFDLLSSVARIEIVLEFTSVIDLFKCIRGFGMMSSSISPSEKLLSAGPFSVGSFSARKHSTSADDFALVDFPDVRVTGSICIDCFQFRWRFDRGYFRKSPELRRQAELLPG